MSTSARSAVGKKSTPEDKLRSGPFSIKRGLDSPSPAFSYFRVEVLRDDDTIWDPDGLQFYWLIDRQQDGNNTLEERRGESHFRLFPTARNGATYKITARIRDESGRLHDMFFRHVVSPLDTEFTDKIRWHFLLNTQEVSSLRAHAHYELIKALRGHVLASARATGDYGITPRFLAAVLAVEIENRNKSIRQPELEKVRTILARQHQGGDGERIYEKLDRSIGVGQLRLSTAAMVNGEIPWVDQDAGDRDAGRERIAQLFESLSLEQQSEIFEELSWPQSNVNLVARTLATLKKRANRYPRLDRRAFGVNERAMAIVATEYNLGATSSPEGDAQPAAAPRPWLTPYHDLVSSAMNRDVIAEYFPND